MFPPFIWQRNKRPRNHPLLAPRRLPDEAKSGPFFGKRSPPEMEGFGKIYKNSQCLKGKSLVSG